VGAEHGGHVGPGRAGGAPARQDVVFHIKGVGALGRAIDTEARNSHWRNLEVHKPILPFGFPGGNDSMRIMKMMKINHCT